MKTTILLMTIIMTSASFTVIDNDAKVEATRKFASSVLHAVKKNTPDQYVTLLPTLSELHSVMAENRNVYGGNLAEAQEDLTHQYLSEIVPSAKESFENLVMAGKRKGIDWSSAQLMGAEIVHENTTDLHIFFLAGKQQYKIVIKRVFDLNNELKATPFISLN